MIKILWLPNFLFHVAGYPIILILNLFKNPNWIDYKRGMKRWHDAMFMRDI